MIESARLAVVDDQVARNVNVRITMLPIMVGTMGAETPTGASVVYTYILSCYYYLLPHMSILVY